MAPSFESWNDYAPSSTANAVAAQRRSSDERALLLVPSSGVARRWRHYRLLTLSSGLAANQTIDLKTP
jgi:hypothetical protein